MKREELLAWIGVVLAIPPIIYMVGLEGKWAAGAFVVLILGGLAREYVTGRKQENRPVFSVIRTKKRVQMQDKDGKTAKFEQNMRVRVNHRTREFITSYLGGDGRAENFQVDGHDPSELKTTGSRTEIVKRFDRELLPGEEFNIFITYDLIGSFPGKKEGVGHMVEFETKTAEMEVIFHSDRPCLSGELLKRYGGSMHNGGEYTRAANGSRLETNIPNPSLGAEYILQWDW